VKYVLSFTICLLSFSAKAEFVGGLAYIQLGEYRVDNEINPLPLGLSLVPMIAYRGERLRVFGPNINYILIEGPVSFSLILSATGDRYKTSTLDQRDASINGGFNLRLFVLNIRYGSDLVNVYKGNTVDVNLGWRFKILKSLFFTPSLGKELLNDSYVNYYYGISDGETERFDSYSANSAVNDVYRIGVTFIESKKSSFTLNYSYKVFDDVIYDSPTIDKDSYGATSFFWSRSF
tara:strand:+ start:22970 stop:23671 length:702 start_codon:yes stop_codon:yes gene_type:complete